MKSLNFLHYSKIISRNAPSIPRELAERGLTLIHSYPSVSDDLKSDDARSDRTSPDKAWSHLFVQIQPPDVITALMVDIDEFEAHVILQSRVASGQVPQPSWITVNEKTMHCQAGWILACLLYTSPSPRD